jgi:hypothetical protein
MKNLHLIKTDKKSKLFFNHIKRFEKYQFSKEPFINGFTNTSNLHIYITNDEKPKVGDWCLYSTKEDTNNEQSIPIICKITRILDSQDGLLYEGSTGLVTQYPTKLSKIIITTDGDLIADGVQKIDDEFLQWFVKNPSCEEVEVEKHKKPLGIFYHKGDILVDYYKIIIPSEEVINPFELPNVLPDDIFNKSLEELAEKEYPKLIVENPSCNGYKVL